jgi:hypothetical protein
LRSLTSSEHPPEFALALISRRTFLVTGIAGAAALTGAWWLRQRLLVRPGIPSAQPWSGLDPEAKTIVAAIVPVMLAGALPADATARNTAIVETVEGVGVAITGLAPAAQEELAQLFALLAFAPARIALAQVTAPWGEAPPEAINAFLDRWEGSRFQLQRSAYDALQDLVYAAWYGNERSWPAIGYPGPPRLFA